MINPFVCLILSCLQQDDCGCFMHYTIFIIWQNFLFSVWQVGENLNNSTHLVNKYVISVKEKIISCLKRKEIYFLDCLIFKTYILTLNKVSMLIVNKSMTKDIFLYNWHRNFTLILKYMFWRSRNPKKCISWLLFDINKVFIH